MKTVSDLICRRDVLTLTAGATVEEAARFMARHGIGLIPVVEGERVIGIFGERDLMVRVIAEGLDPATTTLSTVMTRNMVCSPPDESFEDSIVKMQTHHIRHLIVIEDERLIGVVSLRDLMTVDQIEKEEEIKYLHEYLYYVPPGQPAENQVSAAST